MSLKSHAGPQRKDRETTVQRCTKEERTDAGGVMGLERHTEKQKQRAVRTAYKYEGWAKEDLLEFFQL